MSNRPGDPRIQPVEDYQKIGVAVYGCCVHHLVGRVASTLRLVAVAVPALLAADRGRGMTPTRSIGSSSPPREETRRPNCTWPSCTRAASAAWSRAPPKPSSRSAGPPNRGSPRRKARWGTRTRSGKLAGVEQDFAESVRWCRLAGQANTEVTVVAGREFTSGRAIGFHALMLGKMYRDGIALPRNDVAAHKWLDISERWTPNASGWSIETPDGPVPLADEIRTLAEGMTPEQVAEAQRAADAFLDTYR